MIKVRLHSNEKEAAEAVDRTIRALPIRNKMPSFLERDKNGDIEFDSDGLATIVTPDPGFVRFAVMRQGYVKEVVE